LVAPKAPRAATTFRTLAEAEKVVGEAIRANKSAIKQWAKLAKAGERSLFRYDARRTIGFGIVRGGSHIQNTTNVVFILQKVTSNNRVYFLLTAFPGIL
jgi:hypothetical protein